jgi:hypothetical protein
MEYKKGPDWTAAEAEVLTAVLLARTGVSDAKVIADQARRRPKFRRKPIPELEMAEAIASLLARGYICRQQATGHLIASQPD